MKSLTSVEKIFICGTILFILLLAIFKLSNGMLIKSVDISADAPLDITQTSEAPQPDIAMPENPDSAVENPDAIENPDAAIDANNTETNVAPQETETKPQKPVGKININTANKSRLMDIDGVGEVIAQRIIDYRQKNGDFKTIQEIMMVSGIGEKKFQKMKDQITVQ